MRRLLRKLCRALCIPTLVVLSGCATLPTTTRTTPAVSDGAVYDPIEGVNRVVFKFNEGADKYAISPATSVYKSVFPKPIRKGIGNAARNLGEPLIFVNQVLQLDAKDAMNSLGRFMLNSTVGLAGFIDVAEKNGVPQDKEDLGQTLATYGVPAGPYIVLPLLGPSNLRDVAGRIGGGAANPVFIENYPGDGALRTGQSVANGLEARIRAEPFLDDLRKSADPYVNLRSVYTQNQLSNIHEDVDPFDAFDEFDDFDDGPAEVVTAESCAEDLSGDALDTYSTVSPNVVDDSNLRKMVRKHVGPNVMGGKTSIKKARRNSRAAHECLSLLKSERAQSE